MIDIKNIQEFFNEQPLNLIENKIDFNLFNLFCNTEAEINSFILDVINDGYIKKQASVKFNYNDDEETIFVQIEKDISEINISIIVKVINEKKYQIVSVFPTTDCKLNYKDGCYFPDEVEIYGRINSAVGLCETDLFDPLVLFERNFFEDDNSDDVDWNLYAIAYSSDNGESIYNDYDGVDDIFPYRKVKICTEGIKTFVFNGVLFYKCYTEAALFVEFETENMINKIPVYISEKLINDVKELHNGKEMNVIVFGNIKTV